MGIVVYFRYLQEEMALIEAYSDMCASELRAYSAYPEL